MRRYLLMPAVAAAPLAIAVAGAAAHGDDGDGDIKDDQHFREQALKEYEGGNKAGSAWNMTAVGHTDLGARGFNADVWVHERYAYVGQWGFADWATGNARFCAVDETRGVAVIDARNPAEPTQVGSLSTPSAPPRKMLSSTRRGRRLRRPRHRRRRHPVLRGLPLRGRPRKRGLQLWDVTDPAEPVELALLDTGCCTRGVHEFEVQHRADLGRTFAYATVPTSRYPDSDTASGYRDADGDGDFRLIDITNPAAPFPVVRLGHPGHRRPFLRRSGLRCRRQLRPRRRAVRGREARLRLLLGQRLHPPRPDRSDEPRLHRSHRLRGGRGRGRVIRRSTTRAGSS